MRGAYAAAVVAVEIFVEENVFIELGIVLQFFIVSIYSPMALRILFKNVDEPCVKFRCHFFE
jgi:hypothetical protein